MGTHPIFESDFDCLTDLLKMSTSAGRGWFSWSRPVQPHSLDRLKSLYACLKRNRTVSTSNKDTVVEALRSIAEILIWGDQNDSSVFEFFLEKNMFLFFINLLNSEPGNNVCVQLLQTLNILFENLRHETSLFYLLSNNHVNSILTGKFDFEDEELLAYYISFLKTLSLRLDSNTVHFFFNEHRADFPLFTEALNFHSHKESMVRAAVRTVTLSVYRVREPSLEKFLLERISKPYFTQLIYDCQQIAISIDTQHETGQVAQELLNEHLDFVHYFADIMSNSSTDLSDLLLELILTKLLSVYAYPLYQNIAIEPTFKQRRNQFAPAVCLQLLAHVMSIVNVPGLGKLRKEMGEWVLSKEIRSTGFMSQPADLGQQLEAQREIAIRENVTPTSTNAVVNKSETDGTDEEVDGGGNGEVSIENVTYPLFDSCFNALALDAANYINILPNLIFIYALSTNLADVFIGACGRLIPDYPCRLVDHLAQLINTVNNRPPLIRLISIRMATDIIYWLGDNLPDEHHEMIKKHVKEQFDKTKTKLPIPLKQEELFLEVFEDEVAKLGRMATYNQLLGDISVLSEVSQTPMSGLELYKRLPCGVDEQLRYDITSFLLVRRLQMKVEGQDPSLVDIITPTKLTSNGTKLDLNNADLLGCTIISGDVTVRRFLVVQTFQIILVEPDSTRLGWGVVTFSASLQDLEIEQDPRDTRSLTIRSVSKGKTMLQQLIFDDNIRSLAARQRLSKGRQRARHLKLQKIATLLDLPANFLQVPTIQTTKLLLL